jgi:hypothetical protein
VVAPVELSLLNASVVAPLESLVDVSVVAPLESSVDVSVVAPLESLVDVSVVAPVKEGSVGMLVVAVAMLGWSLDGMALVVHWYVHGVAAHAAPETW